MKDFMVFIFRFERFVSRKLFALYQDNNKALTLRKK